MPILSVDQYKTEQGVIRTKSLFYEMVYDTPEFAVFTVKEEEHTTPDGRPLIPFSRIFVSSLINDPTEYTFAMETFGSWSAWDKIRNSDRRLVKLIEEWRVEADIARKAMAFRSVVEEAQGGKSAFSASKYLIEEPWATKGPDGRSARKRAQETASKAFERAGVAEDVKRLREEGLIQ